jgi:hypothetical protein
MRLRLPQRRLWRAAIYLGSLLLILLAIDVVLVQMHRKVQPSFLTTRIVEPRLPDGRVDYMTAVDEYFGRDVTPENNAAIFLLRAVGPQGLSPKQPKNGVTKRLGMEPLPEIDDYFVPYNPQAHLAQAGANEDDLLEALDNDSKGPVTIGEARRESVKSNEHALDLLVNGSRRSRYFVPFYAGYRPDTLAETYLKHVLLFRQSINELLTRAMIRLDDGDIAGFREDILAVHRWARLVSQAQTLIERLVAFKVETAACICDRIAITSGKLKPDELRALNDELAKLPDLHPPLDAVDCSERYMALDIVQWMAQGGSWRVAYAIDVILVSAPGAQPSLSTRIGAQFLPINFNACMTRLNQYYDAALALARKPTWKERRDGIALWEQGASDLGKRNRLASMLSSDWPAMALLPTLMKNVTQVEAVRAQLRLSRVTAALACFKAEHGSYPNSLAELTPKDLREAPIDPFSDEFFKYVRENDVYSLYSVGPDIVDAHGQGDDLEAGTQSRAATAPTTLP